jgi:microcystin-dependent protein
MWAGGSAPAGWVIAFGQALSRTTYANLFSVIGTTYGAGDGTTTFNVPDFSGRVPVGVDFTQGEFEPMGKTGGSKTHTLTTSEIPAHAHAATAGGFTLGGSSGAYSIQGGATYGFGYNTNTANAGGGGAHNNLQPYLVLRFIIKL